MYDGHGGAEVALYCAENLPPFLLKADKYLDKNYEQALKDAFIGFDATLIQTDIQDELKKLITVKGGGLLGESETEEDAEELEDADDDLEELDELRQESQMPLDKLLEKYHDATKNPSVMKAKRADLASGSKPISPYLRSARSNVTIDKQDAEAAGGSSSSSSAVSTRRKLVDEDVTSTNSSSSSSGSSSGSKQTVAAARPDDSAAAAATTSASSNGAAVATSTVRNDQKLDSTPDSSSASKTVDSSSGGGKVKSAISTTAAARPTVSNGGVSTAKSNGIEQENEISTNSCSTKVSGSVSSSSSGSAKLENGQVTKGTSLPPLDDGSSSTDTSYNGE